MNRFLDLEKYPLDRPDSAAYAELVEKCQAGLVSDGMFNLPGFLNLV